jgi:tetratricopeptide (TPR) repeat protein
LAQEIDHHLRKKVWGKFPEAIEAWSAIARLKPNDYEAHFMIGMLYSWSKKYREGIAPLEKALSL